jgi:hypothetical protein
LEIFMKKILAVLAVSLMLVANVADAKGGGSSGGHGGGGGHASSGGRSGGFSSSGMGGSRPSAPAAAPAPSRPSTPAAAPQTRTVTTTSTTTTRTAGGGYVGGGMYYGGMGMGYGYSNGLLTGLIIGNMMHPHNTVVYTGGGQYNNNALLYPDGRVVNQQGYQVGVYQNGQFTAMNGGMVAQQAPADAMGHTPQVAQPVVINTGPTAGDIVGMVLLGFLCVILFIILIGILL